MNKNEIKLAFQVFAFATLAGVFLLFSRVCSTPITYALCGMGALAGFLRMALCIHKNA